MKPYGVCQCSDPECLEPTPLAPRNDSRFGHVKGEPVRYIRGHGPRVQKAGGLRPRRKSDGRDDTEQFTSARRRFLDAALAYGREIARSQPEVMEELQHDLHELAAEQSLVAA